MIEIGNPETPETHLNSSSLEPENLIATPPKGDAKDQGQKSLVVMHSNSVLSVKVANLQDDIEILKEANHFRRAYETILKMYEQKNSRLVSEKLQLQQMTINLNSVIKKLEQDEQKCQTQILNLQYENLTLMTKIEALQLEIVEQESCTQTIKNQERRIKELTDLHSQMLVEKQAIEHSLSFLQEAFTNAQQQLQESEASRKDQKKQLDKLKSDHIVLQDKNKAEVEQKNKSMNQCMEMEYTICKKEKEIEKLCHANGKLESELKATTLALENLKEEKIIMEKQLLSLQEQLKLEADVRKAEQEQFETKYSWLVSEVKLLKVNFESEQEETESLKQHMDVVMKEHFQYKEQAAVIKDLNHQMMAEIENWKHRYEKAIASHHEKEQIHNQAAQSLKTEIASVKEALKKKEEEMEWKMHMLGRFLLDMRAVHSDLAIECPPNETDCFNSTCTLRAKQLLSKISSLLALTEGILICQDMDTYSFDNPPNGSSKNENITALKTKIKSLSNKKETLENEVRGSPDVVEDTSHPDLLTEKMENYMNEKELDQTRINKLEGLLHLKSEECSKFTEEKCKLLKDLNSLICKVASFEEIIQCADHRLEMYSTHVLHLEKRNQNLVCMIKKLRENSKKHRQRSMAKQSKSMVLMNELDEANPDGGGQNTKFECGDAIAVTRK